MNTPNTVCTWLVGMHRFSQLVSWLKTVPINWRDLVTPASSVLIAQHAKSEIRGSAIGIFSFCGAVGIMVATGLGGQLFDYWLPQGPFVLFSAFGLVVVVVGLFLRKRIVPPVGNS